jgi:hypothetical protein
MNNIDVSAYFVVYNLIIGVLIMLASEKIGVYLGYLAGSRALRAQRLVRVGTLAMGSCIAVVSAGVFLFAHILKF